MRVLVTWGSKRGGTEGIGRILAESLKGTGFDVHATPAEEVKSLDGFDAVIIGGALYANRWPKTVRRFVNRNLARLQKIPVWTYSSGPLDDSADKADIPAPNEAAVLAERIGAKGHVTFGGRLEPNAQGFPAAAMARDHSGDWRNPERIRGWANELAAALPNAVPGRPVAHPARSLPRLLVHGTLGWLGCAAVMGALLQLASPTAAMVVHAILVPVIFGVLAQRYFRARGARDPLPTAITWTVMVAILDLIVVAGLGQRSLEMFTSVVGAWLPLVLVFASTWVTGSLMATMPWAKPPTQPAHPGVGSYPAT